MQDINFKKFNILFLIHIFTSYQTSLRIYYQVTQFNFFIFNRFRHTKQTYVSRSKSGKDSLRWLVRSAWIRTAFVKAHVFRRRFSPSAPWTKDETLVWRRFVQTGESATTMDTPAWMFTFIAYIFNNFVFNYFSVH